MLSLSTLPEPNEMSQLLHGLPWKLGDPLNVSPFPYFSVGIEAALSDENHASIKMNSSKNKHVI